MKTYLKFSGRRPSNFHGSLTLPPSKSYFHRALFVSSLCNTASTIKTLDSSPFSQDVKASMNSLKRFGLKVTRNFADAVVVRPGPLSSASIFASGSGTTARFAIAFAATCTDGGRSTITGDASLSRRPMQPLLDALSQLGVKCYSKKSDGKLPVVVESGGIDGGKCTIDGSISSQFISALLIACTQARKTTALKIVNPGRAVSTPYIKSTLFVLRHFGFIVDNARDLASFCVKGNQTLVPGKQFYIPGDMSSAAALIGATLAAEGKIRLNGVDLTMPQSDSAFLGIARKFGGNIFVSKNNPKSIRIDASRPKVSANDRRGYLVFNLRGAPDLVPIVTGVAAALGQTVNITQVEHLHFKETNRSRALSREFGSLGVEITENDGSLSVSQGKMGQKSDGEIPTLLSSQGDHRMLMSLAIAGISGRFGEVMIGDPYCVAKSYPSFISDLRRLMRKESGRILAIVRKRKI